MIQKKQTGVTLVVSLIMLIVLTLLVVAAIRSGNTNLRISGNMQVQTEAAAAAQVAIEQVISSDFTTAPAEQQIQVNTGAATYAVQITKPTCDNSVPLKNDLLDADKEEDQVCLNSAINKNIGIFDENGLPIITPTACYQQDWDIHAEINDADTGARIEHHQGVSLRVPGGTTC